MKTYIVALIAGAAIIYWAWLRKNQQSKQVEAPPIINGAKTVYSNADNTRTRVTVTSTQQAAPRVGVVTHVVSKSVPAMNFTRFNNPVVSL